MCGRYASTRAPADLAGLFEARWDPRETLAASWNVAPTDPVWAVLERPDRGSGELERRLRTLRWGLVPSWAKDPGVGSRMINARVETVHEKPAYRRAFAKRRCLLPADGFYEWQPVPATATAKAYKQPYFIAPEDTAVMALAGLYEFWRDPAVADQDDPDAWLVTAAIITTEATDSAGRIHPRMPLALDPADYEAWLDPTRQDIHELRALLHTPAGGRLEVRPVSTAVNSVRNNGPHLLDAPA
ncbi:MULTISPECIES: SOS response-associated peptidase [unclassified Streptomyces]|uniref:SOS response-associated peptidase n=1 Tax=unclassified Streptomyces TaxID=2593676 RepID=UPI001BEC890C|nr:MULTISPECIES: SOS response-associated peptidase [unclassified Streptomyces]MBT2408520.1 SOS response-associated peptidase [Streptomyces sp. ISL-21]MBT2459687.1 SOS response-associated peptidase [Streptomyces sp. ISL-86]MBT2611957.1 SOS response-associated peptidase [Streptomyces sp. ISL-87]